LRFDGLTFPRAAAACFGPGSCRWTYQRVAVPKHVYVSQRSGIPTYTAAFRTSVYGAALRHRMLCPITFYTFTRLLERPFRQRPLYSVLAVMFCRPFSTDLCHFFTFPTGTMRFGLRLLPGCLCGPSSRMVSYSIGCACVDLPLLLQTFGGPSSVPLLTRLRAIPSHCTRLPRSCRSLAAPGRWRAAFSAVWTWLDALLHIRVFRRGLLLYPFVRFLLPYFHLREDLPDQRDITVELARSCCPGTALQPRVAVPWFLRLPLFFPSAYLLPVLLSILCAGARRTAQLCVAGDGGVLVLWLRTVPGVLLGFPVLTHGLVRSCNAQPVADDGTCWFVFVLASNGQRRFHLYVFLGCDNVCSVVVCGFQLLPYRGKAVLQLGCFLYAVDISIFDTNLVLAAVWERSYLCTVVDVDAVARCAGCRDGHFAAVLRRRMDGFGRHGQPATTTFCRCRLRHRRCCPYRILQTLQRAFGFGETSY